MKVAGGSTHALGLLAPALLLVAVLLALVGLTRGIDLTDESYYALHFLHWQEFNFHVTFFGAYLDGPFAWLGGSLPAMRGLGLLLVLGSGALFLLAAQRWLTASESPAPRLSALVMGAALALTHYNVLWTLRTPSYNTLALVAMLLSTAMLLEWLHSRDARRRDLLTFGTGLLVGVCLFSKATTAAAMVLLQLLLVLSQPQAWRAADLGRGLLMAVLGFGVNVMYVHLRQPDWLGALGNGLDFARTIESRDPLLALRTLYWDWSSVALPMSAILAALMLALGLAWYGQGHRRDAALVALVVLPVLVLCTLERSRVLWWPVSATAVVAVWMMAWRHGALRLASLGMLLMGLFGPMAYSIGTNISLSMHTQLMALLPLAMLWLGLQQLRRHGELGQVAFSLSSALLVLPGLAAQIWPWLEHQATYRQATAMAQANQALPHTSPLAGLRSDAQTVASLQSFVEHLQRAGFQAGEPLLDFSGANPGLVYAAGGRPLGLAWMLGAYPGSRPAAALVLERQPTAKLESAWLLSSPDAKRRIDMPDRLLAERLLRACHQRVDRFVLTLPAADRLGLPPAPVTFEIWKPRCGSVSRQVLHLRQTIG